MKGKISVIFILLIIGFPVVAQERLFFPDVDSITIDYRTEGVSLDSIDALFTGNPTLRPGSGFGERYEFQLAENLFKSSAGRRYLKNEGQVVPLFTGLPYLSFQYAFGSALTQNMNVLYHHYFAPTTHLHFRYNRKTSNGFLRNGNYRINDLNLKFYHSKGIFSTHFDGYYGAYNIAENGGFTTDSLLNDFEIQFTPVQKQDAASKIRKLDVKWDNYFRLIGDSTLGFGFKTKHRYEIVNRVFTEQLTDLSAIDSFYIDTTGKTRDQFQTMRFTNGAGVYFSSPHFQIDGTINYQHWRNQNLGVNNDTNEVFIHSNLWLKLGKNILLSNQFYFNLIGATGTIKEYASLSYQALPQLLIYGKVKFENAYPSPYLRYHTANYHQWKIQNLEMQQQLFVKGGIKFGNANFIKASVAWTTINNGRYFINDEWRQDTLDVVSVGAATLKGVYHLWKFSFYPSITLRFNTDNFNFQPFFSTLNRISFNTHLFKAKRLGMAIGVDVGYSTEYQYMTYNGVLDLYEPIQTNTITSDLIQLNAFVAFSIEQFRFFVRVQNISTLFQDPTTRIDVDYSIMPMVFRVGVTWDFFN